MKTTWVCVKKVSDLDQIAVWWTFQTKVTLDYCLPLTTPKTCDIIAEETGNVSSLWTLQSGLNIYLIQLGGQLYLVYPMASELETDIFQRPLSMNDSMNYGYLLQTVISITTTMVVSHHLIGC